MFTKSLFIMATLAVAALGNPTARQSLRFELRAVDALSTKPTPGDVVLGSSFRQNGSFADVLVWTKREELINRPPLILTQAAGSGPNAFELHAGNLKLAYFDIDVPHPEGSAPGMFLYLVPLGFERSNVVSNEWTIGKDAYGRLSLGLSDATAGSARVTHPGNKWMARGPFWTQAGITDGYNFSPCGKCTTREECEETICFGIPAVIELINV